MSDMGREFHRLPGAIPLGVLAVAVAALAAGVAGPSWLRAGEALDPHAAEAAPVDTSDLTPEQLERIESLYGRVLCACPEEDWTRTLAGCPHGCSDRQKRMVRDGVKRALADEEILAEQVRVFGTEKVLAIPRSTAATLVPYLILVVFTAGVVVLLAASLRPSRRGAPPAPPVDAPGGGTEEDRRIAEAVERDLEEMDR
jgi:hypothetical protein